MRRMTIATATALFIGGAGVLALAVPASAATTPVTVQVTGGALGIGAPIGPVSLGTASGSSSAQTVTGSLGPVLVTDLRAGVAGWVATAGSTSFTGPQTISGSAAHHASTGTGSSNSRGSNTNSRAPPSGPRTVRTGAT